VRPDEGLPREIMRENTFSGGDGEEATNKRCKARDDLVLKN